MVETSGATSTKKAAPWRGRKRADNPRDKVLRIRCAANELEQVTERAKSAGLSVGAYIRASAIGDAGPRAVRRPRVETEQLARLLAELGKLGSNVNQIARWCNMAKDHPSERELALIRGDVATLRAALMGALGREAST